MANETVVKTIVIRGTSEGVQKVTGDLQNLARAHEDVAVASEKQSRAQLSSEKALERIQRQYDLSFRQQQELARVTAQLDRAKQQGLVTDQRSAQIINLVTHAHARAVAGQKSLAETTKLSRYELINLSRQIQDVGVSLASGQSPLTVLVQQGSQIADVFAASQVTVGSAFKSIASGILQAITPLRVFAAAGAASGAAAVLSAMNWRDAQREINLALIGVGRNAGASLGRINQFAEETASSTKLFRSEARDLAVELLKTGDVGIEQFGGISKLAFGLAQQMGGDLPAANKLLAESFADPARGIDALAAKFGGITAAMREQVQTLAQQGKLGEAQQLMVRIFEGTAKASEQAGTLSTVWRGATNAVESFWTQFNRGLDRITGLNTLEDKILMLERRLRGLQEQKGSEVPGASLREGPSGTDVSISKAAQELAELRTQQRLATSGLAADVQRTLDGFVDLGDAGQQSLSRIATNLVALGQKLAPETDKLREMRNLLESLSRIDLPGVREFMSPDQVTQVERARDALRDSLQYIDRARAAHAGVSAEVAVSLSQLRDQVNAYDAIGTSARLIAQEQALINRHLSEGKSLVEAQALAAQQIAVLKAQEVAQTRESLAAAREQVAVAGALTQAKRIEAQLEAQQAQAARQFAGNAAAAANAMSEAEETASAARAAASAAVQQQASAINQQTELIYARLRGDEASVEAAQAYKNAIAAGAEAIDAAALKAAILASHTAKAAVEAARAADEYLRMANADAASRDILGRVIGSGGGAPGFGQAKSIAGVNIDASFENNPMGPPSIPVGVAVAGRANPWQKAANQIWLEGWRKHNKELADKRAADIESMLGNPQDLFMGLADRALSGGGDLMTAINAIRNAPRMGSGFQFTDPKLGQFMAPGSPDVFGAQAELLADLYSRLAKEDPSKTNVAIAGIQDAIRQLISSTPRTLDRDDLVNRLNDRLKDLTESTDTLNETNRGILSELYTTDPRQSRLGFRAGSRPLEYDPFKQPTTTPAPSIPPAMPIPVVPPSGGPTGLPYAEPNSLGGDSWWTRRPSLDPNYEAMRSRIGQWNYLAGGGIMTEHGVLPLKRYQFGGINIPGGYRSGTVSFSDQQTGGIATSPQVAMYGEGSVAEAYVPVPSGRIPVELMVQSRGPVPQEIGDVRPPERPIIVNMNFNTPISRDMAAEMRMTVYQTTQAMAAAVRQ